MRSRLPFLLALGAITAVAPAQVVKTPTGYLLRVKYYEGQIIRLSSTNTVVNATGQAQDVAISLPVVIRITEVKNGNALARMTVGPPTMNGKEVMNRQTVVMTLNNRNQATSGRDPGNSVGATLPQKPLKIGETWTAFAPISTGTGATQKLRATYKLLGVKTVAGKAVAVVSYQIAGGATGKGTLTLLQEDGTLWTNEMKLDFRTGNKPLTVVSKMKRV